MVGVRVLVFCGGLILTQSIKRIVVVCNTIGRFVIFGPKNNISPIPFSRMIKLAEFTYLPF
jgi:hypothetical protein